MLINTWLSNQKGQAYLAIVISILIFILFKNTTYIMAIPFLLGGGVWFIYQGFAKPSFFIVIFIMVSLFRIQEIFPLLSKFPIALIVACLGFFSLIIKILLKKTELYWNRDLTYFVGFFLWVTLSVITSYNFHLGFEAWSGSFYKVAIGFFLIAWAIESKADYSWFILICVVSGVLQSTTLIYNKYNSVGIIEGTRATLNSQGGLVGDPNDLALLLLVPLSFSLVLFFSKVTPFLFKFLGLIALIVIACGIIATQSRGGLLGLLAITICFCYQSLKSKNITVVLGVLLLLFLYYIAGIDDRQGGLALDESASNRIVAWKAAVRMAINHPLFGVGLNGFEDSFYLYKDSAVKINIVSHSIWFSVLAETGFPGFFLFVACIYRALRSIWRSIRYLNSRINDNIDLRVYLVLANGIFYGLIGFCISGTFLNQAYGFVFYTLFALAISLSHTLLKIEQSEISQLNKGD